MEYYKKYIISNKDNYGLLQNKLGKYYINDIEILNNRCIHNDIVYTNENNEIINIKERSSQKIVGVLYLNKNTKYGLNKRGTPLYLFKPLNKKFSNFYVPSKLKTRRKTYVTIIFNKWEQNMRTPQGAVDKVIGEVGIIENEYEALLYKNNLIQKRLKVDKNKINNDIDHLKSLDKWDYDVFSIDPVGSLDIDDAFHFKQINEKYIEIGIHIADVSRYFDYSTIEHLFNQPTSIYAPHKQINMIPDIYATNICSLRENEIRYAFSLIIIFNTEENTICNIIPCKTTVKSFKSFSYQDAEKEIKSKTKNKKKKYSDLINLYEFTKKYTNNNELDTHKMVEYYMIFVNKYFAKVLYGEDKNKALLRVHNKKDTVLSFDQKMDKNFKKYLELSNYNAAKYVNNLGDCEFAHYALGVKYYTHFTSPIRRLYDILVHYQVKNIIKNEEVIEISENNIEMINKFNKKSRKFYFETQKIKTIFELENFKETDAYIVELNENKIKVYLPEFDFEHKFYISSNKLNELIDISQPNIGEIILKYYNTEITLRQYDKIKVRLTSLKHEDVLDKKLNIKIIDPEIEFL